MQEVSGSIPLGSTNIKKSQENRHFSAVFFVQN
jgi:hypothetical protein